MANTPDHLTVACATHKKHYARLRADIEKALKLTGFARQDKPEITEPVLPRRLRDVSTDDLYDLYDDMLHYSNYLRGQVTKTYSFKTTAKEEAKLVSAELRLVYGADPAYTNEEMRSAAIAVDPRHIEVMRGLLYIQTQHDTHNHRIEQLTKSMRRLRSELYKRSGYDLSGEQRVPGKQRSASPRSTFRPPTEQPPKPSGTSIECPNCGITDIIPDPSSKRTAMKTLRYRVDLKCYFCAACDTHIQDPHG